MQRSSAARRNVLVSHCLRWENINRKWGVWKQNSRHWRLRSNIIRHCITESVKVPYPPCLWATGWMSAVPSFSGLAACWSSSSWNRGSLEQSSSLLCHSKSAADIPLKCMREETKCMRHCVLHSGTWNKTQCRYISESAIKCAWRIWACLLVLQWTTSHLKHEEQPDIEGRERFKSKKIITLWLSVSSL